MEAPKSRDLAPDIKPVRQHRYEVPSSKYPQCGQLPLRSIILAPSGGGKGVLLQSLIPDMYRDCFQRVFVFSPSVNVDENWSPVQKYLLEDRKMADKTKDKLFFDEYDPAVLEKIIERWSVE